MHFFRATSDAPLPDGSRNHDLALDRYLHVPTAHIAKLAAGVHETIPGSALHSSAPLWVQGFAASLPVAIGMELFFCRSSSLSALPDAAPVPPAHQITLLQSKCLTQRGGSVSPRRNQDPGQLQRSTPRLDLNVQQATCRGPLTMSARDVVACAPPGNFARASGVKKQMRSPSVPICPKLNHAQQTLKPKISYAPTTR